MTKILKIENCYDDSTYFVPGKWEIINGRMIEIRSDRCNHPKHAGHTIKNPHEIPSWCPLSDCNRNEMEAVIEFCNRVSKKYKHDLTINYKSISDLEKGIDRIKEQSLNGLLLCREAEEFIEEWER